MDSEKQLYDIVSRAVMHDRRSYINYQHFIVSMTIVSERRLNVVILQLNIVNFY